LKGTLHIKEEGDEKFSKRTFVLVGDLIYYFKDNSSGSVHYIPLSNSLCSLIRHEKKYVFEIQAGGRKKTRYLLQASSQTDLEIWI
jgi:hypothetical protein